MRIVQASIFFALFQIAAGCAERDYEPMSFTVEGSEFVASGVIDGSTLGRFEDVTEAHPDVSVLVLQQVDGSADDVANLVFSRRVRDSGFTTIVPSDGLVASGGTDLFLAGSTRILESGTCVGVHSWSSGDVEGSDLPRNDPEHAKYLSYYQEMGIDPEFYWFTLEAAAAADMHWMTAAEAAAYSLSTEPANELGSAPTCIDR